MSLKIGDTVSIVIGQPLPADEPVDELIYTSKGYMPMSLLELKNNIQDNTTYSVKAETVSQHTLKVTADKIGSLSHITEYYCKKEPDTPVKRSVHVHSYDKLDLFPSQESIN